MNQCFRHEPSVCHNLPCDLQGQSQRTSLFSLSWNYNNANQTRMKFLKCRLGRVWAHQLRKPVQKSLPNWQKHEILLALVPEVTSCPEARSAGVTKEIDFWLSFPVAINFSINQTCKFTQAISVCFSEAGVCCVAKQHWTFLRPQFCTVLKKELYNLV